MATLALAACSTKVTMSPAAPAGFIRPECLASKVLYVGNKAYLPSTISSCEQDDSALTSSYKYDISYSGTAAVTELGTALIPTTLLGTPTGNDNIKVSAMLELSRDGVRVKYYESSCELRFYRGIFSGATDFSALRRQGLFSVKENIEQQMMRDIIELKSLR